MLFLFKMRAGRALWLAWGVAAMLGGVPGPAVAQAFFSTPAEEAGAVRQTLLREAAGLRAALADGSPLLRSLAVQRITWQHLGDGLLTAKDLEPLLQSPDVEIKKKGGGGAEATEHDARTQRCRIS